jgi:two-component system chemotaxis response regulator CheB
MSLSPAPAPAAAPEPPPLRVLICDDSVVIRAAIARILESDPRLQVVARARDGQEGVAVVRRGGIDVVVLDVEMPVMDGLTALPLMLEADPGLRVIVASTLTTRGAAVAMEAMRRGAADYVPKPVVGMDGAFAEELLAKVRGHGSLRQRGIPAPLAPRPATTAQPAPVPARVISPTPAPSARPAALAGMVLPSVIAIGSSTGGPEALTTLFRSFRRAPRVPLLLTQHMPPAFIPMMAEHLTRVGPVPVSVAQEGEALEPGRAYLAPGDRHMLVAPGTPRPVVRLSDGPPENSCRPAVDPMLRSLPAAFGGRVLVAILTGMGQDGCAGSDAVVRAGGRVLAQDAATSVVWGMPGAVAEAKLAEEVLPLPALVQRIAELAGAA